MKATQRSDTRCRLPWDLYSLSRFSKLSIFTCVTIRALSATRGKTSIKNINDISNEAFKKMHGGAANLRSCCFEQESSHRPHSSGFSHMTLRLLQVL
mmetsp:Transcript_777/g.1396  ORF Transcript_777/g.1396 Transcript_777/m.1396 type:complete len:97 (+) Transcript_777:119-409(+)